MGQRRKQNRPAPDNTRAAANGARIAAQTGPIDTPTANARLRRARRRTHDARQKRGKRAGHARAGRT
eukprot:1365926-Lingulodinium_polyedra.AAC.1